MGLIPTKDLIYLAVLVLLVIAMAWWHHDAVLEGEAKCKAAQQSAIEKQHLADVTAAQDVIDGLNQDKLRLQAQLDSKPPVIHTCGRVFHVDNPVPAGTGAAAVVPGKPPIGGSDSSVSQGGGGGDVGPGVRDLALAAESYALYYSQLYQFTLKTR